MLNTRVRSQSGFRKYLANTSWLLAERVARMGVGLLVGVWVARYLGPHDFGLLSYAQGFVFLFAAIAHLGLDSIVVRELLHGDADADVVLGTAFSLKLIGAVVMLGALVLALPFTSNDANTNWIILLIALAMLFQSLNVIDFYFQAKVASKYSAFANAGALAISSVAKILLIFSSAPVLAFAAVAIIDSAIFAFGLIVIFRLQGGGILGWRFSGGMAASLLRQSAPLMASGLVLAVQARIDQVMLKEMVGSEEVGYYSVALRLVEALAFFPVVLRNSLLPAVLNANRESMVRYRTRMLNYYRLSMILSLSVVIPLWIFSEEIVAVLYGDAFAPAGVLLALFSIRLFFTNYGVARGVFIVTEGMFMYSLLTMLVGTAANVALNLVLIPEYHSRGAIFATIISFTITIFVLDAFHKRARPNLALMLASMITFWKVRVTK